MTWVKGQPWRVVRSLDRLDAQIRAAYPRAVPPATPVTSWGAVADGAHSSGSDSWENVRSEAARGANPERPLTHLSDLTGRGLAVKATRARSIRDPHQRFLTRVDVSGGPDACHVWTGGHNRKGYGLFFVREAGRTHLAHRWLLGHLRGLPLGTDEQANHHCDNPPCVNPKHLYIGDQAQNVRDREERRRGNSGVAQAAKTHCANGHLYDEANTYVSPRGWRQCRTCRTEKLQAWRDRPDRREQARQRTREWRERKAERDT